MTSTREEHKNYLEKMGYGPCAKQTVTATLIAKDGETFVSTNYCREPQVTCPRADMPTGQGYEKCINICKQDGHAEVNAVKLAGDKANLSKIYLQGHYYACDNCQSVAKNAGVQEIILQKPNEY